MNQLTTRTGTLQSKQLDYFLVDGSGSMAEKWHESLGAIQAFCDVLASENIHSHGILQVFDDRDIAWIQRDAPLSEWPKMHQSPLRMYGGMTPLYDAINLMVRELAAIDPARASIVIVTDGEENGSNHTTNAQARALLDWCRAKGWQVTFLGSDFNNSRQARLLGADDTNSIGVQKSKLTEAGKLLGMKRANNARSGQDINFTDDEKTQFGGYLTHG